MPEKLKAEFPSQGWRQILTARKEMLDAFDSAREKAKSLEVETFHGKVAEAEFRRWLSRFLPKKYGTASGYIVSPGLKSTEKTPHFDVIIYDQLESPVLWVEDNPDASSQGRSLALPVEYVRGVLEVKSRFSVSNVDAALTHLKDLSPLMAGMDAADERYKLHLPARFFCGLVFFELNADSQFSEAALSKVVQGLELRGFFGGIILRGEGHSKPLAGRLSLLHSDTPFESTVENGKTSLLQMGISQSFQGTDGRHFASMLMWMEPAFSRFAFDIIAFMEGRYEPGRISSFYGMGTSEWEEIL